jgi:GNAT superfamily N-acetyltransferase
MTVHAETTPPAARRGAARASLRIEQVSGGRPLHRFVTFPWRVYQGDPNWVPPLIGDMKKALTKHPFHEHAEVAYFLAYDGKEIVGRIAAIENHRHNEIHDERVCFFGFFEVLGSVDAEGRAGDVATALFETVERWAQQRNLTTLRGPASFSSNEEWGLLVDGFDSPPRIMMTYNPPWYVDLIEAQGFRKAKDLLAYFLIVEGTPERMVRVAERAAARRGVTARPLNMKRYDEEVNRALVVYNRAWEKNWGFVPMTEAEIRHFAKEMKPIVRPEFVIILEQGDEPVGFCLGIPDANMALIHTNGRLFPFGLIKLLWYARKIDLLRVPALGIVPELRGAGLDHLLYLRMFQAVAQHGIRGGEFSWILEDNHAMRQALVNMGADVYKTYRIYERPVAAG